MAGRPWCPGGTALGRAGAKRPSLTPPLPIAPRRGVGCIHYEMATGRPLFPGSTVKEELHLIFRLLGQSPASPPSRHQGAPELLPAQAHTGTGKRGSHSLSTGQRPLWPLPLSAPTSFTASFPVARGPGPSLCASHAFSSPQGPLRKRRGLA